jgi:hypothetical protein
MTVGIAERRLEVRLNMFNEYRVEISLDRVISILDQKGGWDNSEVLGNSLFYYCCGKDPTPVAAFGADIPLYVYSDIVGYGHGDFVAETQALYARLRNLKFELQERRAIENLYCLKKAKNTEITAWKTQQDEVFYLAYIQQDARETYDKIYYHHWERYCFELKPLCICNFRYELYENHFDNRSVKKFKCIEKEAEYIIGYCVGGKDKYRQIALVTYYGDYEEGTKEIPLFKRRFWYMN